MLALVLGIVELGYGLGAEQAPFARGATPQTATVVDVQTRPKDPCNSIELDLDAPVTAAGSDVSSARYSADGLFFFPRPGTRIKVLVNPAMPLPVRLAGWPGTSRFTFWGGLFLLAGVWTVGAEVRRRALGLRG
jgi:hypothetical protein